MPAAADHVRRELARYRVLRDLYDYPVWDDPRLEQARRRTIDQRITTLEQRLHAS